MRRPLYAAIFVFGFAHCLTANSEAPPRFPPQAVWQQSISRAPVHPQSSTMITSLNNLGASALVVCKLISA